MTVSSGRLWSLNGSSRSGKTQKALREISQRRHVLIWDVEGAYKVDYRAANLTDLMQLVRQHGGKKCTIGYTGKLADFGGFAKVAWWYVRRNFQLGKQSAVVFEETSDVTSPAKAPEDYGIILRRGLKYGADLFAISQRPAESDKTSVGNASMVHVCRLNLPIDRKYMASMTGVPQAIIDGLRSDQDRGIFDYVTVDTGRREYWTGTLTFPGGKPRFTDSKDKKPL